MRTICRPLICIYYVWWYLFFFVYLKWMVKCYTLKYTHHNIPAERNTASMYCIIYSWKLQFWLIASMDLLICIFLKSYQFSSQTINYQWLTHKKTIILPIYGRVLLHLIQTFNTRTKNLYKYATLTFHKYIHNNPFDSTIFASTTSSNIKTQNTYWLPYSCSLSMLALTMQASEQEWIAELGGSLARVAALTGIPIQVRLSQRISSWEC